MDTFLHSIKIGSLIAVACLLFNCPLFAEESDLTNHIKFIFSPADDDQRPSDKNNLEQAEIKSTLKQVSRV